MAAKIKLSIAKIEGQGVDIQRVVDGLRNMKAELQSLGCKVSVKVEGIELEAGNGVRTRDLLLGKKGVMVEGESVATGDVDWSVTKPLEGETVEQWCLREHEISLQPTGDTFKNDGWLTTEYYCPICTTNRYKNQAVAE